MNGQAIPNETVAIQHATRCSSVLIETVSPKRGRGKVVVIEIHDHEI